MHSVFVLKRRYLDVNVNVEDKPRETHYIQFTPFLATTCQFMPASSLRDSLCAWRTRLLFDAFNIEPFSARVPGASTMIVVRNNYCFHLRAPPKDIVFYALSRVKVSMRISSPGSDNYAWINLHFVFNLRHRRGCDARGNLQFKLRAHSFKLIY